MFIKEVSILKLKNERLTYKVTRHVPELGVSETKFFKDKASAKAQFDDWLE